MNINAIIKKYKQNEANNAHSENAVLLARNFGTEEDLKKAEHIMAEHKRTGGISHDLYMQRYELTQPLYKIMMNTGK